jgi:hypothetical protein
MKKKRLKDRVICVDPNFIEPLHGITDQIHFVRLAESMAEHGWLGRPLVAIPFKKGYYRAATGSHRLAAATERSLDRVPVLPLNREEMEVLERSKEGYDRDQNRIYSAEFAADQLMKEGYPGIALLLLADFLVTELEQLPEKPLPWTREAGEFYRKSGFDIDPEALEVMAVRDWKC